MMGSNDKPQDEFFYSFNLDDVVPQDHLLRHIDGFLYLTWTQAQSSHAGRKLS
jgi:hypothetical protein